MSAAQRDELIGRNLAGARAKELAAAFRIHRDTVTTILASTGVRRPRSMTPDEIAEGADL